MEAAAILRDQRGINDKNIGFNNEKAMNQLIAHHGVIFKPKSLLMWVSTNPYQCGKFLCYDLKKVFTEYKNLDDEIAINVDSLTIPEDPFVSSPDFKKFELYRSIKNHVIYITKAPGNIQLSKVLEDAFIQNNPESYYVYQLLGNYYKERADYSRAISYYETALAKEVATNKEATQIKEALAFCKNPVKK
jgi:tetratricopeptide (TPR) repeat protein